MADATERFLTACRHLGVRPQVARYPAGTRTAADAAAAVGCEVAQIVKSLVLMADSTPVLALVSGANQVDTAVLAEALGAGEVRMATADEVRSATGYAIGGTPPFGHEQVLRSVLDEDLLLHDTVWAAAGTPDSCFPIEPWRLALAARASVVRLTDRTPGELLMAPLRVAVDQVVLDDLRRRIADTRWPPGLPGRGWEEGIDLAYLHELCEYWHDAFDWRAVEERLNTWSNHVTVIDGQRYHFIHARSPHADAFPLVIHHGWPGSVVEFLDVLGPLTDPTSHGGDAADAFHVVCPSLPGYGLSGPTLEESWTPDRMARAAARLMAGLGYDRYGAQGGDWGAMVTSQLGLCDPEHLAAIHLNMVIAPPPRDGGDPMAGLTEAELADLAEMRERGKGERGYQEIQSTRPQSLSVGLNDSPAGLAAWIVEKFRAWSDCPGGDIEATYTKDQLLANVTLYWVTNTIASANRLYFETRRAGAGASLPTQPVPVPMGYARFPADGFVPPRAWAERLYDVRRWTVAPRGGHFAAMEQPGLLVEDVRAFFRDFR